MVDVSLWWYEKDEDGNDSSGFYVNCNDLFFWACADCEVVVDLKLLDAAYRDCLTASGSEDSAESWGSALYACRQRKMRPQYGWYGTMPEKLRPLFDACGPERDIDTGNPMGKDGE